jgi:Icc-related predicted phosphoesterase
MPGVRSGSAAVKILAISDVELPQMHDIAYLHRTFCDVDVLISCGDLSADYVDVIGSALNLPLFFVRGNHDNSYLLPDPGGENLHRHVCIYKGYSFAGLEGSIRYSRQGAVQYTEGEMFANVVRMLPRLMFRRLRYGYGVHVLVSHSPPQGIHDLPDDFAHRGFRSFRYLMAWARPLYLIHGHVDTWDNRKPRETTYGRTKVININPYKVFEIEEQKQK